MGSVVEIVDRGRPARIDLDDAAAFLLDQVGPRLQASRGGGRQRLADLLCGSAGMHAGAANRLIALLEHQGYIGWVSDHDESRACPRILGLCGVWVVRAKPAPAID